MGTLIDGTRLFRGGAKATSASKTDSASASLPGLAWISQIIAVVAQVAAANEALFYGRVLGHLSALEAEEWLNLFRIDPGLLFSARGNAITPEQAARFVRYLKIVSGEQPMDPAYIESVDPHDPLTDASYLAGVRDAVVGSGAGGGVGPQPTIVASMSTESAQRVLALLRHEGVQRIVRELLRESDELRANLPGLRSEVTGLRTIAGEIDADADSRAAPDDEAGSTLDDVKTTATIVGGAALGAANIAAGIAAAAVNAIPGIGQIAAGVIGVGIAIANGVMAIVNATKDTFHPTPWQAVMWLTLFRIDPGLLFAGVDNARTPEQAARLVRYFKLVSGEAKMKKGWGLHNPNDSAPDNPYQNNVDPSDPLTDPKFIEKIHEVIWRTKKVKEHHWWGGNDYIVDYAAAPPVVTTPQNAENILGVLRVALKKAPDVLKWSEVNNPGAMHSLNIEIKRIRRLAGEHGPDPLLSRYFGDVTLPPAPRPVPVKRRRPVVRPPPRVVATPPAPPPGGIAPGRLVPVPNPDPDADPLGLNT